MSSRPARSASRTAGPWSVASSPGPGSACPRTPRPPAGSRRAAISSHRRRTCGAHARLRAHAESVAFFGGGPREAATVDARFREVLAQGARV
ncbi:MAG: hypothetical protein K2X99_03840, partial [Gemmatimonadaceae bacterium]|nr:hypothetical protein [Gemmatimonadaceae bacterium]